MTENSQLKRAVSALFFSVIVACLLAFAGLLGGSYVWAHHGRPSNNSDDTDSYLCGLLVGGVMAIGGGAASLWRFWPRPLPKPSQQ
jgi:hypothetical protein